MEIYLGHLEANSSGNGWRSLCLIQSFEEQFDHSSSRKTPDCTGIVLSNELQRDKVSFLVGRFSDEHEDPSVATGLVCYGHNSR